MNHHDRLTPAEAANLERETRMVCAHCRRPTTRETTPGGALFVRHTFDHDHETCPGRDNPIWAWLTPANLNGYRMETP